MSTIESVMYDGVQTSVGVVAKIVQDVGMV